MLALLKTVPPNSGKRYSSKGQETGFLAKIGDKLPQMVSRNPVSNP
jgi:hypothetical protein